MRQMLTALLLSVTLCGGAPAAAQTATLRDRAKPYIDAALDAGQAFAVVSAASGMPNVAADSLAAALGTGLASQTATGTVPYPTEIGRAHV